MKTMYSALTVICLVDLLFAILNHNIPAALGFFCATCFAFIIRITIPYLFDEKQVK